MKAPVTDTIRTQNCKYRMVSLTGYYYVTFLFALFITFEIFKSDYKGFTILYSDIFYILFVIYTFLIFIKNKKKIHISNKTLPLFGVFILLIISTLNFIPPAIDQSFDNPYMDGTNVAVKYVIRNILQLCVYVQIIFINNNYQKQAVKGYCKGFLCAIIIHSVYSIVQMVFMYTMLEDIHTKILGSIGITKETINHDLVNFIGYPIIRNCGFHWDPAYFGLWGCLGLSTLLYTQIKSSYIKLITWIVSIAWFFSFSRSGYFAFICGFLIMYLSSMKNASITRFKIRNFIMLILCIICVLCLIVVFLPNDLQEYIFHSIEYRFTYNPESKGTARHLNYPIYAIEGSLHDIWHFIFGYGPRNSSRGIAYGGNLLDLTSGAPHDIESDLCKMLLSYGIVGLILYLLFNYYMVKYFITYIDFKQSSIYSYFYIFGIIGSFFAGIFYMYNDSKWIWFLYLFAIIFLNNTMTSKSIMDNNDRSFNYHCKL